uniref:Ribosome recycling factor domain-containing protein n=1 Tax=Phaeomonas parva TaxID=124430 RepID=A0A7S1U0D6_9STRA
MVQVRGLAKKGKGGGGGKTDAALDEAISGVLPTVLDFAELSEKASAVEDKLKENFAGIRGGRPEPGMFDHVMVDAYGSPTPMNAVAQVALKTPKAATVTVFDPSVAQNVAEALEGAGMDLNPQVEGNTITVPIPKLTRELREDMAKAAGKQLETAKQALRRLRKSALDEVKDNEELGELSEDDAHREKELVDALTKRGSERLEALHDAKRAEVLEA